MKQMIELKSLSDYVKKYQKDEQSKAKGIAFLAVIIVALIILFMASWQVALTLLFAPIIFVVSKLF